MVEAFARDQGQHTGTLGAGVGHNRVDSWQQTAQRLLQELDGKHPPTDAVVDSFDAAVGIQLNSRQNNPRPSVVRWAARQDALCLVRRPIPQQLTRQVATGRHLTTACKDLGETDQPEAGGRAR